MTSSPAAPDAPARLAALMGEWDFWITTPDGTTIGPEQVTFEWLDGTGYLRQHSEIAASQDDLPAEWREHAPTWTTSVFGFDDASGQFVSLYTDSRGVHRIYQMSLEGGVWRLWREAPGFHQRFTGTLSADGQTITARWEMSEDGQRWRTDFDLSYARIR